MNEDTPVSLIISDLTTTTPSVQVYEKDDTIGGEYLVRQVIRDGGMADVYFCLHVKTDQPYALKTFKPKYWANEKIRQLFEQEIRTWVALQKHPNIVRCHYLTTLDDLPFMVLEWVADFGREYVDLKQWLKKHGALDLRLALNVAIDVCHGLIHAQQKQPGLVHRDIKPANILLTYDLTAKITDFGLATLSQTAQLGLNELLDDLGSSASLVQLGSFVGTPDYAAPEQWHGGVVDSRVDIYAIGCLLYEMVTGQRPFKVDFKPNTPQEKAARLEAWHVAHVTSPLPSLPATLPSALQEVIHSCLQKEPAQRLGKVELLLSQLQQIYQQQFGEMRPQPIVEKFDIQDYFDRARTYFQLNDFEEAIADYDTVIQLGSTDTRVYAIRGWIYHRQENHDKAIADYSESIRLNYPEVGIIYYCRGLAYEQKANYSKNKDFFDQAISDYTEAIQLEYNLASLLEHRGKLYAKNQNYDQAIADYKEIIRLNPNLASKLHPILASTYNDRGSYHNGEENYDQALADYNEAIQLDPNLASAYFNRGQLYENFLSDNYKALADYRKTVEINPGDTTARFYLKTILHILELDETIGYYKTEGLDHDLAIAYYNRGNYYDMDDDRAIADYSEAIQCDPNLAVAYFARAELLEDWRNPNQALADYHRAIEIKPDYVEAHNKLRIFLHNLKIHEEYPKDGSKVIKPNPKLAIAYYNLGNVYAELGHYNHAIYRYNQAIEFDPNLAMAYFARANLYEDFCDDFDIQMLGLGELDTSTDSLNEEHRNKLNRAIADYRKAIEINPDYAEAHHNLGILEKLGKINKDLLMSTFFISATTRTPIDGEFEVNKYFASELNLVYIELKQFSAKKESHIKVIASYQKTLVDALHKFGLYFMTFSKIEEGKKYLRQAIDLDPSLADELAQYLDDEA